MMRCGNHRCRCRADPPQLHGPYLQWTRKTDGKTVTRFGYVNLGPPCYARGFPIVRLYDRARRPLNVHQIDGNIVLGTAKTTRYLFRHNNVTGGFNIETPTSGPCTTARYVAASFGGGTTPLATVDYRVCGRVYVTPLFR